MSQYLLSTYARQGDQAHEQSMTPEEMQAFMQRVLALESEMKSSGTFVFTGRLHDADAASQCHLVFVPGASTHTQDILRAADTRPIVTVGEHDDFLKCVKTRKDPYFPVDVGHRVSTICHLANISIRLGRKLKWDPKAERFESDAEANAMLSRPMRSPWKLG